MNAVVRILDYTDNNPQEADFMVPTPPPSWPSTGSISAENISFRYRANLPNVIDSISFQIAPREKVGVVGRTGSGKSTLTLGLLRIIELATNN
jgi:ABC-type multidrug transport system fused ATPase/permease subunit